VDDHADIVIAENGAVLAGGGEQRVLAAPVPGELDAALAARGVAFRRGEVLLACDGAAEPVVLGEVRRLGLECQLVRNRGALMVLPSGVSKGAGLAEGLAELGISCHNAVAIGDAENDHSLLAAAELAACRRRPTSPISCGIMPAASSSTCPRSRPPAGPGTCGPRTGNWRRCAPRPGGRTG